MNDLPLSIAFIDDEADDVLKEYRETLGDLAADWYPVDPPQRGDSWDELEAKLQESDLVLIDHNLLTQVDYDGGMLSVRLRRRLPTTPLVLVTRSRFDQPGATPGLIEGDFEVPEDTHVVDEAMYRQDLVNHTGTLRALVRGYRTLRRTASDDLRTMAAALELLGATENELSELRTTGLDVRATSGSGQSAMWDPQSFVTWVRHTLFAYPGPLLDLRHAAAAVGLSPESFSNEGVQSALGLTADGESDGPDAVRPALYKGVFADPGSPRWWRSRLFAAADAYVDEHLGSTAELRALAVPRALTAGGVPHAVALCNWDRSPGVDTVCYVSGEPVKLEHSLGYRPDARPPGMEEARVSFRSIVERNDYDERLFAPAARRQLARLQDGEIALPDSVGSHDA